MTDREQREARLRELSALQRKRPLSEEELYEVAAHLYAIGDRNTAGKAEAAAKQLTAARKRAEDSQTAAARHVVAPRPPIPPAPPALPPSPRGLQQPVSCGTGCSSILFVLLLVGYFLTGPILDTNDLVNDMRESVVGTETAATHQVTYKVTGTARAAGLTFTSPDGSTNQIDAVDIPWEWANLTFDTGSHAYLSAQNAGETGSLTAEIWLDGHLWKRGDAAGAYTIAGVSGMIGSE